MFVSTAAYDDVLYSFCLNNVFFIYFDEEFPNREFQRRREADEPKLKAK